MPNQHQLEPTKKFPFKKSFVAFIDILGFSERFLKDPELCLDLLSEFAKHNGEHSDINDSQQRQIRPNSLCFSDNIGISIPAELNLESELMPNEFYSPLITILHSISFFAYYALSKGMLIRGAIAYGDMYQSQTVIAGKPFIEAVKYEKIANYPRIIVTPSATKKIEEFSKTSPYGWNAKKIYEDIYFEQDDINSTPYFNWLDFHKFQFESNRESLKQIEIFNAVRTMVEQLTKETKQEKNLDVLQKLNWMKQFLEKSQMNYHNFDR